jgi:hypothetical protein
MYTKVLTRSRFWYFCTISTFLLASLLTGEPSVLLVPCRECMYSTITAHWNIKSPPASPGRRGLGSSLMYSIWLLGHQLFNLCNWTVAYSILDLEAFRWKYILLSCAFSYNIPVINFYIYAHTTQGKDTMYCALYSLFPFFGINYPIL